MYISKRNKIMIRTTLITLMILVCAFASVVLMGNVFAVGEKNMFGNDIDTFKMVEKGELVIFGNKVNFPFVSFVEKATVFLKNYSPGIIKLLGFAVDGVKELFWNLGYMIFSSLK